MSLRETLLQRALDAPLYYKDLSDPARNTVAQLVSEGMMVQYGPDVQLTAKGRAELATVNAVDEALAEIDKAPA